jgi:hypothetical protein
MIKEKKYNHEAYYVEFRKKDGIINKINDKVAIKVINKKMK